MDINVPVKALVVDDAAFMRKALVDILSSDSEIEVVGVARHGKEALEVLEELDPDVITLDVDMPVMDGLTTIKHIMIRDPRPVVMVSALAHQGRVTLEALRLGAVDFFPKPSGTVSYDIHNQARKLSHLVKQAAKVNPRAIKRAIPPSVPAKAHAESDPPRGVVVVLADIGASSSLIRMLANINPVLPLSFLVCQGLTGAALGSYTSELNLVLPWLVSSEASSSLFQGSCLLTDIQTPWTIESRADARMKVSASQETDIDRMLKEVAELFGSRAAAVVLGGTTAKGLQGLKTLKESGGLSLVLEPRSTVCDMTARMAMEAGVAIPVAEHAMWAQLEAFGRRLALESLDEAAS